MKYIILRCEDLAPAREGIPSLIGAAKTTQLAQLSQAGAAGRVYPPKPHRALNRFQVHRGLFGLAPEDPEAGSARCYAASIHLTPKPDEVIWCCELLTQHDGRIMDPTAGNIPTEQSRQLIQMLNAQFGSERRRWQLGEDSHHVFVVRDESLTPRGPMSMSPPELLVGRPWLRSLPKGPARDILRELLDQISALLEEHPVNRVRADLGENPANLVWVWGPSPGAGGQTFRERTGLSGLVVSSRFPMRGFAQCLGLAWEAGPDAMKAESLRRLMKSCAGWIQTYDLVYIHLPIAYADPVERLCAMERIDQLLLKPLSERLTHGSTPLRLLVTIDDRALAMPFVAFGTTLARQPIACLTAESFAKSPLQMSEASQLFRWFTKG